MNFIKPINSCKRGFMANPIEFAISKFIYFEIIHFKNKSFRVIISFCIFTIFQNLESFYYTYKQHYES